jgi:hypothetical protein
MTFFIAFISCKKYTQLLVKLFSAVFKISLNSYEFLLINSLVFRTITKLFKIFFLNLFDNI